MGDVIPSQENLQAMLEAYTQQAISEGAFGPRDSFDDSPLGVAKKRAATEAVRRELYQPTVTELFARPTLGGQPVLPKVDWASLEQEQSRGLSPIMNAAVKRLQEEAAANRKAQKEKEAANLKEALQKRRDSMK